MSMDYLRVSREDAATFVRNGMNVAARLAPNTPQCSAGQRFSIKLYAGHKSKAFRKARLMIAKLIFGREITSFNELSDEEAYLIIGMLEDQHMLACIARDLHSLYLMALEDE